MPTTNIEKQIRVILNSLNISLLQTNFEEYETKLKLFKEFILLPEGDSIDKKYENKINRLLDNLQNHAEELIEYTKKNDQQNMIKIKTAYDTVSERLIKVINDNEYKLQGDLSRINTERIKLIRNSVASLNFPPRKTTPSASTSASASASASASTSASASASTLEPIGWKTHADSRFLWNSPLTATTVPVYSKKGGKNITKKYNNKKKQKAKARTRARTRARAKKINYFSL